MKARLIVASKGPNPLYDPSLPNGPNNRRDILHPVGMLMDHPRCFYHCLPDADDVTRAEPADDECLEIVNYHLGRITEAKAARAEALPYREGIVEETEIDGENDGEDSQSL